MGASGNKMDDFFDIYKRIFAHNLPTDDLFVFIDKLKCEYVEERTGNSSDQEYCVELDEKYGEMLSFLKEKYDNDSAIKLILETSI